MTKVNLLIISFYKIWNKNAENHKNVFYQKQSYDSKQY